MKVGHIIIHAIWAPAFYVHIDKGMITGSAVLVEFFLFIQPPEFQKNKKKTI